jgi:hypothetical protein
LLRFNPIRFWSCNETYTVTPYAPGTPVPQYIKDIAQGRADNNDWYEEKITYWGPFLAALWEPLGPILGIGGIGLHIQTKHYRAMQKDPPRPELCYSGASLYIPSANEVGLPNSWYEWYGADPIGDNVIPLAIANIIWDTQNAEGWGRYIEDSYDAAGGCLELGDTTTASYRTDDVRNGIRQLGNYAWDLGGRFKDLAIEMYTYFNPVLERQIPCDQANWEYYNARPDVYDNDYYGPWGPFGSNGAWQHYVDYGQYEGMTYDAAACPATLDLGWMLYGPGDNIQNAGGAFAGVQ